MGAALALLLVAVACGSDGATTPTAQTDKTAGPTRTLTDDAGRAVTVPAKVERIVSIGPAVTEVLAALGLSSKIVGADDFSAVQSRSGGGVPRLGEPYPTSDALGPRLGIDLEALVSLRPGLVIAEDRTTWGRLSRGERGGDRCSVPRLDNARIPVFCVSPLVSQVGVDGALQRIVLMGDAAGAAGAARELAAKLEQRKAAVAQKTASQPKVRVLLIGAFVLPPRPLDPGIPVAADEPLNGLVELAGGINVFAGSPEDKAIVRRIGSSTAGESLSAAFEEYARRGPQAILLQFDPVGVERRPGWDTLEAVRQGRVLRVGQVNALTAVDRLEEIAAFLARGAPLPLTPTPSTARYKVNVRVEPFFGGGRVTLNPPPGADGRYQAGIQVTLEAAPAQRYQCKDTPYWSFTAWEGAGIPRGTSEPFLTIKVDSDKEITAYWREFFPPKCGTPTPPTPTPIPGKATFNIVVDPPAPKVGDIVRVTVSASGRGGIPQYTLDIEPAESPALTLPANDLAARTRRANTLGTPVSWELKAVRAGTVTLAVGMNYETWEERDGRTVFFFTNAGSGPVAVTVTERTASPTPTPTPCIIPEWSLRGVVVDGQTVTVEVTVLLGIPPSAFLDGKRSEDIRSRRGPPTVYEHVFQNVSLGRHEVTVSDGCNVKTSLVNVS